MQLFYRPQVATRNQGVTWITTKNCQWNAIICIVSKVQRAEGNAREKTWRAEGSALATDGTANLQRKEGQWPAGALEASCPLFSSLFIPVTAARPMVQPVGVHALHPPISFTAPNTHSSAELKSRQAAVVWLHSPTQSQRHSALNINSRLHQLPLWAHTTYVLPFKSSAGLGTI